jgi:hypothetical protein
MMRQLSAQIYEHKKMNTMVTMLLPRPEPCRFLYLEESVFIVSI